ncbi:Phosphoglucomutase-2 [Eumeta japonica]|uniref:Phosphoglucomutase-2 n=1 Tax=Eumeta variegata TaxID=151549 RepID=A0A4C1S932_EUMVA|nr:Phosphoglucomutase-2 [Eumeta japonica]
MVPRFEFFTQPTMPRVSASSLQYLVKNSPGNEFIEAKAGSRDAGPVECAVPQVGTGGPITITLIGRPRRFLISSRTTCGQRKHSKPSVNSGDPKLDTLIHQWLKWDKNPDTRKEAIDDISHARWDKLKKCMNGRQKFGTAGLRGKMGLGTKCMNDVVILQTAQMLTYSSDFGAARRDPWELRTVVPHTYTLANARPSYMVGGVGGVRFIFVTEFLGSVAALKARDKSYATA